MRFRATLLAGLLLATTVTLAAAPPGLALPAGPTSLAPRVADALLRQERANLALVERLLPLAEHHTLAAAVASAKLAARWQAEARGEAWAPPLLDASHALPGDALRALAARHGMAPTPEQEAQLRSLDALPQPARDALAGVVDRFLDFEAASVAAFADARPTPAPARETYDGQATLADLADASGVHFAPLLAARNGLLDAALLLKDAFDGLKDTQSHRALFDMPPLAAITTPTVNDTYESYNMYFLLIDGGGNDTYLNNAGSNNLDPENDLCNILVAMPAAALIDLGGGNDRYGDPAAPRKCGTNGGGYTDGAGFLLDDGGDDAYVGATSAINGGGTFGAGFLLDGGGSDTYTNGGGGANGGGIAGLGFLLDVEGDDLYLTGNTGVNGAGAIAAVGFLLDGAGNDTYLAGSFSVNGAAQLAGVGFLLDAGAGNDAYTGGELGANGGGESGGSGFLYDGGGNDSYTATECAGNGAGGELNLVCYPGRGFLFDGGGFDRFEDWLGVCENTVAADSCRQVPHRVVGARIDAP